MAAKGLKFKTLQAPQASRFAPDREPDTKTCAYPGCRAPAHFGFGVRLRYGQEGTWYCGRHQHEGKKQ